MSRSQRAPRVNRPDSRSRRGPGARVRRRQTALAINVTSIILSGLVLLVLGVAWFTGGTTGDFKGDGNGNMVLVNVENGSSLSDLSDSLVDDDVVASSSAFMTAAANNPRADQLQPGWYRLEEHMSAAAAVDALLDPENRSGTVDIPTGSRLEDTLVVGSDDVREGIFTKIAKASCVADDDCITVESLRDAAATTDPAELGVPDWAIKPVTARGDDPRRLEGLISPGVHQFNPMDDAKTVLTELVTNSVAEYEETGLAESADNVGLTPYELLTAASLVQMEASDEYFPMVARVILNRLDEPMRLQFDSTVNYGLDDQEIATTDEDREEKTPWNTYASDGLPQTPISSPSVQAIKAMENPAPGAWLYFVTVDKDGTTVFTNTLDEHGAAIEQARANGVLDSNR
ncbi:endolytic transglycosylase MltG [Corynebacterium sp. TAE3-ERU12]|uniref:endolytic transglycosylase MltG n=1 Tax=Corynebacterium sp. TAE3-ERU12 TaxID=2849491 RepID=UPI001C488DD3|nr:endolytic transglycosylase MltG [Corynebacterium sp. TAE3-ERU12]MBV7295374.1 endolytic transglycosylase MltG [Corynebacterium sp. TAE3-ERU12]